MFRVRRERNIKGLTLKWQYIVAAILRMTLSEEMFTDCGCEHPLKQPS